MYLIYLFQAEFWYTTLIILIINKDPYFILIKWKLKEFQIM